ncbi:MAG: hypothetical protein OXT67_11595 [Zetaproteobacteria bacterium]|nr:hypothetical protein [Zetaproteobacteria bacterium]
MQLTHRIEKAEDWDIVRFSGDIDEEAEIVLSSLPSQLSGQCIFDLKDIQSVNSCGVRAWINFMRAAEKNSKLIFEGCTPEIVSQINMIPNFKGDAHVRSVYASYVCDSCDTQKLELFEEGKNLPKEVGEELAEVNCPSCNEVMEMEELEDEFFGWLEAS